MESMKIVTGYRMAITSAWFLTVVIHPDKTATVLEYARDHMNIAPTMAQAWPTEDAERNIVGVRYDGVDYVVRNPQHVFSYVDGAKHEAQKPKAVPGPNQFVVISFNREQPEDTEAYCPHGPFNSPDEACEWAEEKLGLAHWFWQRLERVD